MYDSVLYLLVLVICRCEVNLADISVNQLLK